MGAREMPAAEIEATLRAIRERVRARQPSLASGAAAAVEQGRDALTEAMDAAYISAHLPVVWDVPVLGRLFALTKRATRILLRWYINPIVDQQNDFNAAALRALSALQREVEALRVEVERQGEERGPRIERLDARAGE